VGGETFRQGGKFTVAATLVMIYPSPAKRRANSFPNPSLAPVTNAFFISSKFKNFYLISTLSSVDVEHENIVRYPVSEIPQRCCQCPIG
jgi:hypothetical protein